MSVHFRLKYRDALGAEVRQYFNTLFSFCKLLDVVLGPVSVEEHLDKYPNMLLVKGLMENRFDGT